MKSIFTSILCVFAFFVTTNAQWTQLSGGPYGGEVYKIAAKGNVLVVGTKADGIYRSTDDGGTWIRAKLNGSYSFGRTSFLAVVGETFLAAQDGVYFRSTDNGATWVKVAIFNHYIDASAVMGTTVYLLTSRIPAATRFITLLRSTDFGESWDTVSTSKQRPTTIAVSGTTLFFATELGDVYHTKDSCKTWRFGYENLGEHQILGLNVQGENLYASVESKGIFRSSDFGDSWTAVSNGINDKGALKLTSNGTSLFAATTRDTIYRSTDNGDSWKLVYGDYKWFNVPIITTVGSTIYFGRYGFPNDNEDYRGMGGLFRSTDNGENWNRIGITSLDVNAFGTNGTTVFVGAEYEGLYRSTNSGKSMSQVGRKGMSVYSIMVNGSTVFAGADSGLFRSMDNGDSWVKVSNEFGYVWGLAKVGTTLFAGSRTKGIFRSTDNGDTWVKIDIYNTSAMAVLGNTVFSLSGSAISRSTDNGDTWQRIGKDFSTYALLVVDSTIYAGNSTIYKSTDLGDTWTQLNTGSEELYVTALAARGTTLYAATQQRGILRSFDDGKTWSQIWEVSDKGYSATNITSLMINGETLFAGTNEYGAWRIDLRTLDAKEDNREIASKQMIICYPNPTTNTLTIDRTPLQFPENTPVHYTLSTLVGGKVMEFDNSESHFTVQLDGVVSGVYCLAAESGGKRAAVMVTVVE